MAAMAPFLLCTGQQFAKPAAATAAPEADVDVSDTQLDAQLKTLPNRLAQAAGYDLLQLLSGAGDGRDFGDAPAAQRHLHAGHVLTLLLWVSSHAREQHQMVAHTKTRTRTHAPI